jgi:hypothetical protein
MSKDAAMALVTQPVTTPEIVTTATSEQAPSPVTNPEIPQADAARFAAIARKEAMFQKEREAFKREHEAYLKEKEQVKGVLDKAKKFEELRSTDGVAALKEVGFSETDIFNLFASLEPKKELTSEEKTIAEAKAAAAAEIKAFKEEAAKKESEAAAARDKQLIDGLKSGIGDFIKANPEEYRYCSYYGEPAVEQAYEIIKAGLASSNGEDLIDFKEAVKMAEEYFQEKDLEMEKIRKRPQPEQPTETPKTPERSRTVTPGDPRYQQNPTITRTRTLSNDARVTGTNTVPKNETRDQKKERLINMIKSAGLRK